MRKDHVWKLVLVVMGGLLLITAGCVGSSSPTQFYVLSSMPDTGEESRAQPAEDRTAIGVGPVDLPLYLDRPQIMTRISENRMRLADFDQWAEPVTDNFTRVLMKNLSELLSREPVAIFSSQGTTPLDLRVSVDVIRFDGSPGKRVQLMARWIIYDEVDKKVLVTKDSNIEEPLTGSGYEAMASGLSRTVEILSKDIAEGIKGVL